MKIENASPPADVPEPIPAVPAAPAAPEAPSEPPAATPPATPPAAAPEAPAPATPPAEEISDGSEAIDWGKLNEDLDVDQESAGEEEAPAETPPVVEPGKEIPPAGEVVPPVPATPKVPAAEVSPPTTPAVPAVPPAPKEPVVPPVTPVAETPTPVVPPVVPLPTETPEQQAEASKKVRMEQHSKLKDYYKLSDEDAASMVAAPQEVVPDMLANLHMTVLENTMQTIVGMLPQMVSQVVDVARRNEEANKAFFTTWPKLAKQELYAPLERMIGAYRQANPEMPQDQLIKEVGAAAHLAFKIAPDEMPGVGAVVPAVDGAPPAVPVVPVAPAGGFVPAVPGGGMPITPVKKKDEWGTYNDELDKDEAKG